MKNIFFNYKKFLPIIILAVFFSAEFYAQVGIKTTNPQADLDVNGDLRVSEIPVDLSSNRILVVGDNNIISQNVMPNFFAISGLVIPICRNYSQGSTGSFQTQVNGTNYNVNWRILFKTTGTQSYPLKAQRLQVKYDFNPPLPFKPDGFSLSGYNDSNYPDTFSLNYTDNSAESITVNITRTDMTSSDENKNCWAGQFFFDMMMYRY
ncbi:MAG TPA: hypothetical protein VFM70_12505 [Salinimicrobium sp.]|nr:hypothetical protein [Salinimicrobium sp.]